MNMTVSLLALAFCNTVVRIEFGQFSLHRDNRPQETALKSCLVLLLQLVQLPCSRSRVSASDLGSSRRLFRCVRCSSPWLKRSCIVPVGVLFHQERRATLSPELRVNY